MQLNSNVSNQAESVEVFTSSSNEGGAMQNSSSFVVGRAIQNSNYEDAHATVRTVHHGISTGWA